MSEIAHGLKAGSKVVKPFIVFPAWDFLRSKFKNLLLANSPKEAVKIAFRQLNYDREGLINKKIGFPDMVAQKKQREEFIEFVKQVSTTNS